MNRRLKISPPRIQSESQLLRYILDIYLINIKCILRIISNIYKNTYKNIWKIYQIYIKIFIKYIWEKKSPPRIRSESEIFHLIAAFIWAALFSSVVSFSSPFLFWFDLIWFSIQFNLISSKWRSTSVVSLPRREKSYHHSVIGAGQLS